MDLKLQNQVAIVTGAGQGIGKAIALALAAEGVDIVAADVNIDTAIEMTKEIESLGRKSVPVKVDVSNGQNVKEMVDSAINKFGKIDILVNNAGISIRKKDGKRAQVVEIDESEWDRVIAINLKGVFNCCKYVLPHMIKRNSGNIINISSSSAKLVDLRIPSAAHYNASKAGVSNLTMSLANEVAPYGIRVNAIAPGRIITPMAKTSLPDIEEVIRKATPLGRAGLPEEIAKVVLFLASHMSSFVTGEILDVNGGIFMD